MARVIVIGSLNVDLVGMGDALPRPGETVLGHHYQRLPGGKGANQAVAASLAGADTLMIGAVGGDADGGFMRQTLDEKGVDTQWLATQAAATGVALITIAQGENQILVVPGANAMLDPAVVEAVNFTTDDVVLAQNEVPVPVIKAGFAKARAAGAICVYNPAPATTSTKTLLPQADVLVFNDTEMSFYAGVPFDPGNPQAYWRQVRDDLGVDEATALVLTRGEKGVIAATKTGFIQIEARAVTARDSTGAGDCFCGYLAAMIAAKHPMDHALRLATMAASLSVERVGAIPSIPALTEVAALLS
ncbi:MAG: ribokinase [Pseudomonadota bacterium]